MTHTGQGGGDWPTRAPIPVDETAALVAAASDGELAADDFHARPGTHPLCYRLAYLLRDGDGLTPFTRFAAADRIAEHLRDSYLLRPEAAGDLLRELVDTCYARGDAGHLHSLRRLQEQLFPPDATLDDFTRQRRAEDAVRTIYLHAHMDEDTFDCSRAMLCPDQVPVAPDRLIPACTYNLFYRQRDPRFYVSGDGA